MLVHLFVYIILRCVQRSTHCSAFRITIQDTSCSVCCSTAANPFSMVKRVMNCIAVASYLSGFVELFLQSRYRHDSDWTSANAVCDVQRCKYAHRYVDVRRSKINPLYTGNHHKRRLIIAADDDVAVTSRVRYRLSTD